MNRIGLALSGGGFRATLYHLGLVRFLRDAKLLSQVTHITSVSGGSIFAAHLALNWDRYNGSPHEFDAAASDIISMVRLDIRNRIARRFPLTIPLRWPRRLLGLSNRKLSRTGLLEYHYEKYLYGDTSLFELPKKPQLHILATNLSEGCLCSFARDGLLIVRRQPEGTFRIDRIRAGLATVPMAVTASSAFPGFFPPLELTGADVGASGEFGRQAYIDGGVFDNLGVRMFRCLERSLLAENRLQRDDFFDLPAVHKTLHEASQSTEETPLRRLAQALVDAAKSTEETPLRRLAQVLVEEDGEAAPNGHAGIGASGGVPSSVSRTNEGDLEERMLSSLRDVMAHYQFYHEPLFARLKPVDPVADAFLQEIKVEGRIPNAVDQVWLNRHLLEAAFRDSTGQRCFRRLNSWLDAVIVSDVGKPIAVEGALSGGIIRTALRSSDILMDRVWQLEQETFRHTAGFVFAPITRVVEPNEDPTALHPEVQRQLPNIRTDLDRFSLLEISALLKHGYCVGRRVCQEHPALFGTDLPCDAPWDPVGVSHAARLMPVSSPIGYSRAPKAATVDARSLQASAVRIFRSLFDPRDWTSYAYLPLFFALLIFLPHKAVKYYEKTNLFIEWLYQGNTDIVKIQEILQEPPAMWPEGSGATAETVDNFEGFTNNGLKIVQETRIVDLRLWDPAAPKTSMVQYFRGARVLKESEESKRFLIKLIGEEVQVRFPPQPLPATLLKTLDRPGPRPGTTTSSWGVAYDFSNVAEGQIESVSVLIQSLGTMLGRSTAETSRLDFNVTTDAAQLSMWVLMPSGRSYKSWMLTRESGGKVEQVAPFQEFLAEDFTIIGFEMVTVKVGETYAISWTYR